MLKELGARPKRPTVPEQGAKSKGPTLARSQKRQENIQPRQERPRTSEGLWNMLEKAEQGTNWMEQLRQEDLQRAEARRASEAAFADSYTSSLVEQSFQQEPFHWNSWEGSDEKKSRAEATVTSGDYQRLQESGYETSPAKESGTVEQNQPPLVSVNKEDAKAVKRHINIDPDTSKPPTFWETQQTSGDYFSVNASKTASKMIKKSKALGQSIYPDFELTKEGGELFKSELRKHEASQNLSRIDNMVKEGEVMAKLDSLEVCHNSIKTRSRTRKLKGLAKDD